MAQKRTLMRENVKSISTKSVSTDEIETQRQALAAAQRRLDRLAQRVLLIREKIAVLRDELAEAKNLHRENGSGKTKRSVMAAVNRLDTAIRRRNKLLEDYRELKQIVRDENTLCKKLEKKEEAKQKAVAKFLNEWERNYDREVRMKEKNVRQRKRLARTRS
jgi:uncharacterized protein YktA (UPF0223 family)